MITAKKNNFSILSKLTAVYVYLMLTVFLLYCGKTTYLDLSRGKLNLFYAICGGYVVLYILLAAELLIVGDCKFSDISRRLKSLDLAQRMALLYVLFTWASALISEFFPDTLLGSVRHEGALTITLYVLCFLFVSFSFVPGKVMPIVLCAASVCFAVICIFQLLGKNPFGLYPEDLNYFDGNVKYSGEYLGTIGNADLTSAFVMMAAVFLCVFGFKTEGKIAKLVFIPAALLIFVLFKMNVSAGILGFAGSLYVSFPFIVSDKKKTRKTLCIILLVILIAVLVFIYFSGSVFYELSEVMKGNFDESFGSGRIHIWKEVLRLIPKNLLFGHGPDTMLRSNIEPFVREDASGNTFYGYVDAAHNEYLNVLFHQGVFALICFLTVIIFSIIKGYKEYGDPVKSALAVCALAYALQAFFGISTFIVSPFFWIVLGTLNSAPCDNFFENTKRERHE